MVRDDCHNFDLDHIHHDSIIHDFHFVSGDRDDSVHDVFELRDYHLSDDFGGQRILVAKRAAFHGVTRNSADAVEPGGVLVSTDSTSASLFDRKSASSEWFPRQQKPSLERARAPPQGSSKRIPSRRRASVIIIRSWTHEGAGARSLGWQRFTGLDAEGHRKMIDRLGTSKTVEEPRFQAGCQVPPSGE